MYTGSQEAIDAIAAIIKDMKLKQELTGIAYRIDHQDYQVVFDDTHHCEIRDKLITDFMTTKNGDAKRQIQFQLRHLIAWEDWEKSSSPAPKDDKMEVEEDL